MSATTALEALPPSAGDASVAALLLRDLAAALVAEESDRSGTTATRVGTVGPGAVTVDDEGRFHLRSAARPGAPTDVDHAPYAAPELFAGSPAAPGPRSEVYAAAVLALTRYLGIPALPARPLGPRPTAATRIAAQRQAQRTVPARFGTLPGAFRPVFTAALAKELHLRPRPAQVVAALDAALAATGGEDAARARVLRLLALAKAFEPAAGVVRPAAEPVVAGAALHLPLRTLPAFSPSRGLARTALIAAVTLVATGGVAVAAVVGLSGTPSPTPNAQAVETLARPSGTASPTASPATSSVPSTPASSSTPGAPAPAATPTGGSDGSGSGGSGGSTAGNGSNGGSNGTSGRGSSGRGSTGRGSGGSGGSTGASTPASPPPASTSTPPPSDPATTPSDPGTTPSDPGTTPSDPGTTPTDPGTPTDPATDPTTPAATDTPSTTADTPTSDDSSAPTDTSTTSAPDPAASVSPSA